MVGHPAAQDLDLRRVGQKDARNLGVQDGQVLKGHVADGVAVEDVVVARDKGAALVAAAGRSWRPKVQQAAGAVEEKLAGLIQQAQGVDDHEAGAIVRLHGAGAHGNVIGGGVDGLQLHVGVVPVLLPVAVQPHVAGGHLL